MTAPEHAGAVVVTGAGNGIGRAIVRELAARAVPVVGLDTDAAALDTLSGTGIRTVVGDVRDRDALQDALAHARVLGGLGGWVNNAGIVRLAPLHAVPDLDVDEVLGVNLTGVVRGCQVAVQAFREQGTPGSIVNVSSIHGRAGFPGYALYDTAKGGVEALTRYVCVEYGHLGIRCNAIAPGVVDTAIVPGSADPGRDRDADLAAARALSPMQRISSPAEIAGIVAFLLSTAAEPINGQVIGADNGMSARVVALPPHP